MKKLLSLILILMMVIPVQAFADISPEDLPEKETGINGIFEISTRIDNEWIYAGNLGFGKFQETKEIDLGEYLKGNDALIKISQKGGGASYLDAVLLDGMQTVKVNGAEGKVLNKLSKEDLDITPVEDEIILEFKADGEGILSVTGRIENEIISQEPLQFPLANNYKNKNQIRDFYKYKLNSNYGKIAVDGVLDEIENLKVFAREYQVTGSGHPAGDTYFWVMNDDENLHVVMDFTPDNTYDGDKDYAKVYVNTDDGIKEFKVSVPETTWGSPGFTYTDNVVYEHKVYEFAIPFSEIGNTTDELELAFVGYGTAALPPDVGLPRLAYDLHNGIYLSVFQDSVDYSPTTQVFGQFVYKDNNGTEKVLQKFRISNGETNSEFPDVAYDIENEAFLVVWSGEGSIDSTKVTVESVDKKDELIEYDIDTIETLFESNEIEQSDKPVIAYDSDNSVFLVVWENYNSENDDLNGIMGIVLEGSEPISDAFNICEESNYNASFPAVCYNGEDFLVVWIDETEATRLLGKVIYIPENMSTFNPNQADIFNIESYSTGDEVYAPVECKTKLDFASLN